MLSYYNCKITKRSESFVKTGSPIDPQMIQGTPAMVCPTESKAFGWQKGAHPLLERQRNDTRSMDFCKWKLWTYFGTCTLNSC